MLSGYNKLNFMKMNTTQTRITGGGSALQQYKKWHAAMFCMFPDSKSEWKKGASGQSFIRKEITTYRIGTLDYLHTILHWTRVGITSKLGCVRKVKIVAKTVICRLSARHTSLPLKQVKETRSVKKHQKIIEIFFEIQCDSD